MRHSILILMGTYQGEAHLAEQIKSIISQTYSDWTLLVRDDGSSDQTLNILKAYADKDSRIEIIQDNRGNLRPCQNFGRLMQIAGERNEPYIMFADQDDVWHKDKIMLSLHAIEAAEKQFGQSCPILVHTDLRVIDASLKELSHSYWHYQNLNPMHNRLNRLMLQNIVTGCTAMINKPLLKLSANMPQSAIMHDWWLALTAAAFGKIVPIKKGLIDYRQHGKNQIGAQKWGLKLILKKLKHFSELRLSLFKTQAQAAAFLSRFNEILKTEQKQMLACYAHLNQKNFILRRYLVLRHGFLKTGLLRNLGIFLSI